MRVARAQPLKEMSMSSRTSTTRQLLRASAALGATLLIGAATAAYAAAPALEAPSVRVSYHDLNLATEKGTLAIYGRIVAAARMVCRVSDIRDLHRVADANKCRAQGIER